MYNLDVKQAIEAGDWFVRSWLYDHAGEPFPEDDWFSICDNWDVNLWTEYNRQNLPKRLVATIYAVKEGGTETDFNKFHRVWEKVVVRVF